MKINVFAINLAHRIDRKENIIKQFAGKPEFNLIVVTAIQHKIGAYGLWQTVRCIVADEAQNQTDFFILCEDDHVFTNQYSFNYLYDCICNGDRLDADLISGGFSWFAEAIQISNNLFWVDRFNGMQFTIIFRKFYNRILTADFGESVITDVTLSSIAKNKFVMFPYISVQQEFGYSDVTTNNNTEGYVESLFSFSQQKLEILSKVKKYYSLKEAK